MKADKELIEYIQKRKDFFAKMAEENKPHSATASRHIYASGQESAWSEILALLEAAE